VLALFGSEIREGEKWRVFVCKVGQIRDGSSLGNEYLVLLERVKENHGACGVEFDFVARQKRTGSKVFKVGASYDESKEVKQVAKATTLFDSLVLIGREC
jgi:hypothetical protein